MTNKLSRALSRPFVRFALSGGVAAAINILSRMALSQVTTYSVAIVCAYVVGMTTAFVLMKLYVFEKSARHAGSEYLRFAGVNVIALVQVWAVSLILARNVFPLINFHFHAETIAHVIGVLSPIATSYFLHKYFTFGGPNVA
ncbi:GtrA family protein|uniref:GtrA family protein n=1 Tax=Rhizobium altiplani TaxID=1864509 RepID=UPI000AADB90D|nr:GtrA family protein [Rhizobium altiplani]